MDAATRLDTRNVGALPVVIQRWTVLKDIDCGRPAGALCQPCLSSRPPSQRWRATIIADRYIAGFGTTFRIEKERK